MTRRLESRDWRCRFGLGPLGSDSSGELNLELGTSGQPAWLSAHYQSLGQTTPCCFADTGAKPL